MPVFGNSWSGGVGPHGGSEHGGGVGVVVVVGTVVVVVSVSVVVVSVVELVDGGGDVVTGGGVVLTVAQSSLPGCPSLPAPFAHVFGGVVLVVVVVLVEHVSGGRQSSP